jgi:hypothetical protein
MLHWASTFQYQRNVRLFCCMLPACPDLLIPLVQMASQPSVILISYPANEREVRHSAEISRLAVRFLCRPCSVMLPRTAMTCDVHYLEHVISLERGHHGILAGCRACAGGLCGICNAVLPFPESDAQERESCCASNGESPLERIVVSTSLSCLIFCVVARFVSCVSGSQPWHSFAERRILVHCPCASAATNT